jgi:hypothetical protein
MAFICLVPSSGYNTFRLSGAGLRQLVSNSKEILIAYRRLLFRLLLLLLLRGSVRRSAAIPLVLNNWRLQLSNIITDYFRNLRFLSATYLGIRTKDGILFLVHDSTGHVRKTLFSKPTIPISLEIYGKGRMIRQQSMMSCRPAKREWWHTRSHLHLRLARVMTTTRSLKQRENEAIESNALGTWGILGPIDKRSVLTQEVALPDVEDKGTFRVSRKSSFAMKASKQTSRCHVKYWIASSTD